MTDLNQLKADLTACVLAKCLEKIPNCYVKLEVSGMFSIKVDNCNTYEIEVDAVCNKVVIEETTYCEDASQSSDSPVEQCQQTALKCNHTTQNITNNLDNIKIKKEPPEYASQIQIDKEHINPLETINSINVNTDIDATSAACDSSSSLVSVLPTHVQNQYIKELDQRLDNVSGKTVKRKKRKLEKIRQYTEEALLEAVKSVKEQKMPIRKAARQFGIPVSTLGDKIRGTTPVVLDPYRMRTFSREVEEEIADQLENLGKTTDGLTYNKIRECLIAAQEKFPTKRKIPFSRHFMSQFLIRWPQLQKYCETFHKHKEKPQKELVFTEQEQFKQNDTSDSVEIENKDKLHEKFDGKHDT